MQPGRGSYPAIHILVTIAGLIVGGPAGAGRVESRWVQTQDRPPNEATAVTGVATDDAHPGPAVDHHDVRLLQRQFLGVTEATLYFAGGSQLFPALRIHGNRQILALRLMHRRRKLSLEWVSERWPEAAAIRDAAADAIGYVNGAVYLYDRADDGAWARRELRNLELRHTPVGHQLAQTFVAGGVALTSLFAHPGPETWWLALTGVSSTVAAGTCAAWLAGGWAAAVELGPPELCDAP